MSKFKEEAIEIIRNLSTENIKFLNLVDRIGADKVIEYSSQIMTREKIEITLSNIEESNYEEQSYDNSDIIQAIIEFENPFLKESGFNQFYDRAIAKDKPAATFDNVYVKDPIDGEDFVKNGIYKNIFSGLKIKIENGDDNYLKPHDLLDRLRKRGLEKVVLADTPFFFGDNELLSFYTEKEVKKINKQFTLYHELAHATGVQIFSMPKSLQPKSSILNETHSDLCSVIKIIKENDMNVEQSLALFETILIARSRSNGMGYNMFDIAGEKYLPHMTHVGLLLLRDLIKNDLEYLKKIEDDEISKFSWLVTEQAHQESYIKMLAEEHVVYSRDPEVVSDLLKEEIKNPKSLLGIIVNKQIEKDPTKDWIKIASEKMTNDDNIALDISFRFLRVLDKNKLKTMPFPFSSIIRNTVKEDFEFFKKEFKENKMQLSKVFDSNELVEKYMKFKNRLT